MRSCPPFKGAFIIIIIIILLCKCNTPWKLFNVYPPFKREFYKALCI